MNSNRDEVESVASNHATLLAELLTSRILLRRALEDPCGQECVDWAISLLEQGSDGDALTMLAGQQPPHNHFEIKALRERVLGEQGTKIPGLPTTAETYARLLLREAIRDYPSL